MAETKTLKNSVSPKQREKRHQEMYSIKAENLKLTYSDGTEAVKGISLKVPEGEFFGFLGPNGAGKSTTIKILVTLLKPTDGDAEINGFKLKKEPQAIRETIGYMGQETKIDEELTAKENIRYFCEAYGVPKEEREERVNELLELVELSDVANKRARGFSGGMKKRLDTATALVHEPPLIFLDEPTTGFDPKSRRKLWNYIKKINNEGRTIFLTTQYLEEAELCDRIAVIKDGEIIAIGSPSDLKERVGGHILEIKINKEEDKKAAEKIAKNTIGSNSNLKVDLIDEGIKIASDNIQDKGTELLVELKNSKIELKGFNLHEPTLDDVFLALTGETASENKENNEFEEVR
ncbi:MAG: ABC-type multidrug transport system, ATPase component CcmA [Candidatus Methanohalarchaeum thermophilum]|uniref:ABC-type multidrug transport system, ATPase component CcmA n=1 Tax=Methanohalarchaeum thermophilum TaxID=1903181 RepID=A0A1Q6DTS3_METT1|nr:MAG: ABC-type multidrug transport system, ATPase component CcmA [Candidatus Methanohalarchaeum thermophilum]